MSIIKGDGGSLVDPRVAEIDRLRAELASRQIDVETFREGNQKLRAELDSWKEQFRVLAILEQQKTARIAEVLATDAKRVDEYNTLLGVIAAANARIAELETERAKLSSFHDMLTKLSQTTRDLKDWQDSSEAYRHDAEKAEADCAEAKAMLGIAKAHVAALCDLAVYSDSYGVPGSDFACCHFCRAGGAPNVVFKHDDSCPVERAEATAQEWWDERREAEADCKRAEAERDALREVLEFYANKRNYEFNVIVDNGDKARAALNPSPAEREG